MHDIPHPHRCQHTDATSMSNVADPVLVHTPPPPRNAWIMYHCNASSQAVVSRRRSPPSVPRRRVPGTATQPPSPAVSRLARSDGDPQSRRLSTQGSTFRREEQRRPLDLLRSTARSSPSRHFAISGTAGVIVKLAICEPLLLELLRHVGLRNAKRRCDLNLR